MWSHFFTSIKEKFAKVLLVKEKNIPQYKIKLNLLWRNSRLCLSNLYDITLYHLSCCLYATISSLIIALVWIWNKIKKIFHCQPYMGQYLFSNSNFLLVIRPKPWQIFKKKSTLSYNFPPPGYGIPFNYQRLTSHDNYKPKREYGLYLFPGKLKLWFRLFALSLPILLFLPFKGSSITYYYPIIFYIILSSFIYYILFNKLIPPSLSNVWNKWPISAYKLFLSVPHAVYISHCDRYEKKKTEDGKISYKKINNYIFWRPYEKKPMWRQSTEHSPEMQSLQELILNLAVFELLFHKKDNKKSVEEKDNDFNQNDVFSSLRTLHEIRWYAYLFSPVWINLALILLSLVFFTLLKADPASCQLKSLHVIANFPYNFIFAVSLWYLLTVFYSVSIINYLNKLSREIRKGFFNQHLHLIPQQILDELSYIPSHKEIEAAMHHLRRILGWITSVVFIGLMAILEVLSQAFGDNKVTFCF